MSNITNLKCVACGKPIEIGEPLLANKVGELAHQSCVSSFSVPHVTVHTPKVEQPPKVAICDSTMPQPRPKFWTGIESVMMKRKDTCSECGDPCIGMCPHCRELVCQAFGYNSKFCGLKHEAKCFGAREARNPTRTKIVQSNPMVMKVTGPLYDSVTVDVVVSGNGHKKRKRKNFGPRRRRHRK